MYKILVVDDEPYIRLLLEDTIESMEHPLVEVISAENGQQALDMIKEHKPNIVFLDVMMPRLNGFSVCHTVKKEWKMADVYICMVSAKSQGYDVQRSADVGANNYIFKPFSLDDIIMQVRMILKLNAEH